MQNKSLPQYPESYWRELEFPSFPKLDKDLSVDVAIVGGGITGITAAHILRQHNVKIALIEAGKILTGTTGHTTAKITAQHGLIYDELIQHFGVEGAKQYYDAANQSIQFIKDTVSKAQIECDFLEQDAFIYATTDEYATKIQTEAKAYEKLKISGGNVDSIPFNIDIKTGLRMTNQAQFHPTKYLTHLVKDLEKNNVQLFENTTAIDIEDPEGDKPTIITRDGNRIRCNFIIVASHYPFYDGLGFYFTRMYVERSYILGVKAEDSYPGGMYLSADDPTRSIRFTPFNGENLILIGGENHKTGQGMDTFKHHLALQKFAEETFQVKDIPYRWSAQDLITLDKVPYIGPITETKQRILIATGYRKWGMTNGTAAAMMLSDFVLGKQNSFLELYAPSRFQADPSLKKFTSINADVAKHLIKGKLEFVPGDPSDLETDQGSVVMVDGKRAGAYRDADGKLHLVDTTCRHLGCECEWNHAEKTWDCPCHGSRYSYTGEVLNGPALEPLKKVGE
ncbi:FAD-dependent oxidoreductase [Bacillus sp. CGMCC 1.16607]|uniref:FAD-dependent oxidoreductase n=1 Tax=Bacillus sp. CGMCC 1.16607 TaxID=3351842 RepID=UPI00363160B0